MTYRVHPSRQFRKDVRRIERSHRYDLQKLRNVILMLQQGKQLPETFRNHSLQGEYKGFDECHIESDWLLIYKREKKDLILFLTRTGTHADVFGE